MSSLQNDERTHVDWKANLITAAREEKDTWIFVGRALLALFLTGWLAMRFNLSSPSTAMLSTVLILNRQSGMIIAKSFYRTIGTLVGAVASIALMGLFGQHRELFLLGFACWVGCCAGGAAYVRNFMSYAFVLSGYTTCFITLTTIDNPQGVFTSAIARGSEVMLAIIVTTIVHEVIFPQRMGHGLWQATSQQFSGFFNFVRDSIPGQLNAGRIQKAQSSFMQQAVKLEDLRSYAIFENTDLMARTTLFQRSNQRFMESSTSLHSLHQLMIRIEQQGLSQPYQCALELYQALVDAVGMEPLDDQHVDGLLARLERSRIHIIDRAETLGARFNGKQSDEYAAFDTVVGLLLRVIAEMKAYAHSMDQLHNARPPVFSSSQVEFMRTTDHAPALINGFRAILAILAMGTFWICSAWPIGENALLNTGIYSALFASMPNPTKATLQVSYGYALAIVAMFIYQFFILTHMDGYLLLAVSYTPFIMIGFLMMTRPQWFAIGLGYAICFVYVIDLKNPHVFELKHFLNDSIAQLVGLGVSAVFFMIIPAANSYPWVSRRIIKRMHHMATRAALSPMAGLRERFESASRDIFNQVMSQVRDSETSTLVSQALAIHEAGRTIIELRQDVERYPLPAPQVRVALRDTINRVARFYDRPSEQRYARATQAMQQANLAIRENGSGDELRRHFYLLWLALLDARQILPPTAHH